MAISDTQKVDYLWKKLGYGSTKTDTNANKLAPNEAIASPLILRGDKVWQQASSIPTVQPGSSAGVVTVYPTSGPQECTEDITATANRSWKTGLTDWIPPEIGSTYQAKVYIHTSGDAAGASGGDQVFATGSGNDDEWFFDYQSGVLHFIGTNLPNGVSFTGKSVYVAGARYTGTFGVGSASGDVGNIGNLQVNDTTFTSITSGDDITIDAEGGTFIISGTTGFVIPVGNTAQRDGSPDTGLTRYNSETNALEVYDGSGWDTIGDYTATVDSFDGDNSTTAFTMSAESTTDGTIVDINGVVQLPTTAYSVSGNVVTFTEAPKSGDKVTTRLLVTLLGSNTQAGGTDTQVQFNDGDVLAGDSGFTYNKTANALTVSGNLTVNEITIPGVDGTAGQALLTYGNGVTYFGNVASSGLGNIVEDTTPQLGGSLDLNSNDITGTGDISTTGTLSLTNTTVGDSLLITTTEDSSSAGPVITLKRNSSSPADADYLGQIKFKGENDADQEEVYAKITGKILDASDGSEDGIIEFAHVKAGTNTITGRFRSDSYQLLNGTTLTVNGLISTDSTITATGNVTGGNLVTAGVADVTGNITGGNLITAGLVSATGNVTGGNLVTAGLTSTGTLTTSGTATFSGDAIFDTGVEEAFDTLTSSTGTVTHNCDNGHIFYHTTPSGNITANFTNLGLTAEYATTVTCIVNQGATAYIVNAVQIGGSAQTINWQGGVEPTGTDNGIDSFSFTILNDGGTYVVLGQMVDFT